jgi:hypothetical protein
MYDGLSIWPVAAQECGASFISGISAMACPCSSSDITPQARGEGPVRTANMLTYDGGAMAVQESDLWSGLVSWQECMECLIASMRAHSLHAALQHKASNAIWTLLRCAACQVKLRALAGGALVEHREEHVDDEVGHGSNGRRRKEGENGRDVIAHGANQESLDAIGDSEKATGQVYRSLGQREACACAEVLLLAMCRSVVCGRHLVHTQD